MCRRFDIIGYGNALVDVHAKVDDHFLLKEGLVKGAMNLISEDKSESLYTKIDVCEKTCAGSIANTTVGVAALGGSASYVGKVSDDELGRFYAQDIKRYGVHFDTTFTKNGHATGRCIALVTSDSQRSFGTYLGACRELGHDDIDEERIKDSHIIYVEGYLWDFESPAKAMEKAMDIAKKNDVRIAFSLSDAMCVERFRDVFLYIAKNSADILLGNESEFKALFGKDKIDDALDCASKACKISVVTMEAKGAVALSGAQRWTVPSVEVKDVVDTTGAGDAFAAGFLFGVARGNNLESAAGIGNKAASEIIRHYGAKPKSNFREAVLKNK